MTYILREIPVSQVLRCRLTNHDDKLAVGLDLNTTLNAGGYPAWIARVTSRFLKVQGPRIAILSMKKAALPDGQVGSVVRSCGLKTRLALLRIGRTARTRKCCARKIAHRPGLQDNDGWSGRLPSTVSAKK